MKAGIPRRALRLASDYCVREVVCGGESEVEGRTGRRGREETRGKEERVRNLKEN